MPLQAGWGKQLTYVFGVGRHGAADVTRRYTKDWAAVQRRCVPDAGCLGWQFCPASNVGNAGLLSVQLGKEQISCLHCE